MNSIIENSSFISGSSIYVEFGKPSKPGQFRILFSLATPTNLDSDNFFHSFSDLFELPIYGGDNANHVKLMLLPHLEQHSLSFSIYISYFDIYIY